jgi:hypothetical protein
MTPYQVYYGTGLLFSTFPHYGNDIRTVRKHIQ